MAEIFAVETRGIGKPDYSKEISMGQIRPGIALKYNQQLKYFGIAFQDIAPPSGFAWVGGVLPPGLGASVHIFDMSTGEPTPFIVPPGYTLSVIEASYNFNQDCEGWLYMGFPGFPGSILTNVIQASSGVPILFDRVIGYSTSLIDPTAALPHTVDIVLTNRGLGDMRGGFEIVGVLEAIGTPPFPTEKDTRCKFCGAINNVPVTTTVIVCKSCGKTYLVYDTTKIRRL